MARSVVEKGRGGFAAAVVDAAAAVPAAAEVALESVLTAVAAAPVAAAAPPPWLADMTPSVARRTCFGLFELASSSNPRSFPDSCNSYRLLSSPPRSHSNPLTN